MNNPLRLRRAARDDCKLLWDWANDPDVRRSAFSQDPIPWATHVQWFNKKLSTASCLIFIGMTDAGVPVGQVRFDLGDAGAEIDVSIASGERGKGYGSALIATGIAELLRVCPSCAVHAFVKPDNEASLRSFLRAGFQRQDTVTVRSNRAIHLQWPS